MKYQFCIRFDSIDVNSAASKAVLDCNKIFAAHGYTDYTFTVKDNSKKIAYYFSLLKQVIVFFLAVKKGSLVGVQYPLLSINKVFKYFIRFARLKNVSFFCVIHDLESLRTGGKDSRNIHNEIQNLNYYNVIIVHNDNMLNWLAKHGVTKKMISLMLFDYLCDDFHLTRHYANDDIVYAGNLTKSAFIYDLPKIKKRHFTVYGPNFLASKLQKTTNVKFGGEYGPERIPKELEGSFGLIWDGFDIESCDEVLGNYLRYNNPHKCSLYIAAGLPIIAPTDSAIGLFILKSHIGLLIDNLHDLTNMKIDPLDYQIMKNNVQAIRQKLIKGDFFSEAIRLVEKI